MAEPGQPRADRAIVRRRCAQFQIELSGGNFLTGQAVDAAIEEMLFAGGALNRRLLGGEHAEQIA